MCRSQHTCRLTIFFEIIAKRAYTTIRDLRVVSTTLIVVQTMQKEKNEPKFNVPYFDLGHA